MGGRGWLLESKVEMWKGLFALVVSWIGVRGGKIKNLRSLGMLRMLNWRDLIWEMF
jgi:hypothetical protein